MNYTEMTKEEQFQMQKLMLHHYTNLGIAEGLGDVDVREHMVYELGVFEEAEKYEECCLIRDVIKIWDEMNE